MTTPWLNIADQGRSLTGIVKLQEIGHVLHAMPGFEIDSADRLRPHLGDWRGSIDWPAEIFTDPLARSEFYVELGLNPALTDFPASAFDQAATIAGIKLPPPPRILDYDHLPGHDEDDEEIEFERNNAAYDRLQRFETHVRMFIDQSMTAAAGKNWIKHRVPGQIRQDWRNKQEKARDEGEPERPLIAYADFTDYATIIVRNDNWTDVFKPVFRLKTLVHESFQRLYPIRICTMHSRLITQDDELYLHAETAFVRRAGGLAELLSRLEMDPFRLRIRGTAGCGKSLVARGAHDRAIENGRRPLLVCFNRSLAERLRARVRAGGYVDTWNGFCARFLESQGAKPDFAAATINPRFWQEVQEPVIGADIPDDWLFDTLVVDEGQDFEQEWCDILKLFLTPNAEILWLEDADQNIYGKEPVPLPGFVGYRADTNFRSPESIATFIRDVLLFRFEIGNDLPGLGVAVHAYDVPEDQLRIVSRLVRNLNRRGFAYHDIVVLTCRGVGKSVFSEQENVGNVRLRRFTGDYDLFGNQLSTDGQLAFDSVYRFKGQEAPAVILVDVDPNPERLDSALRLLYCGMTRATVRLETIVSRGVTARPVFASV